MKGEKKIQNYVLLVLLWVTCQSVMAVFPPITHFYIDETEEPPQPLEAPETVTEPPRPADCIITIQVTKKLPGHCMNLGKRAKGCVAGTMLHPFHPDC